MQSKATKKKKHHLTICLVKKDDNAIKSIVKNDGDIKEIKIGKTATLYIRPSSSKPPSWLDFFKNKLDASSIGIFNASSTALLLVQHDNRVFSLTFGQGRHLLEDGVIEQTFGLRVVLNAINPERIRTIDRDSLDVIGRRTREQVSKEDSITSFGLNIDQDLVRAVTGKANDKELGERLTGSDALSLNVPVEISDLEPLLAKCLKLYHSKVYKKTFSWIDHIAEIRDPSILISLDGKLINNIRKKDVSKIWLAVPEVIEWVNVRGFRYTGWHSKEVVDDIYMPDFLARCTKLTELTVDILKRWKVECINAVTEMPGPVWSLYSCIYAEINYSGSVFLLNGGQWYRVDRDFVKEVNEETEGILRSFGTVPKLPSYNDASEEDYNKRICEEHKKEFALMDRKIIPYSGRNSSIEFCDLYSRHHAMLHIKRYSGSSVLSHLFAQGVVAAEAFAQDAIFREKVNAKLPTSFKLADPRAQIDPRNFEVVFGIVSRSENELELPFFSRVTLRNAYRRLNVMRYKMSVVKISNESKSSDDNEVQPS
jgi:uncharacterized protein (TIGR04141 family)